MNAKLLFFCYIAEILVSSDYKNTKKYIEGSITTYLLLNGSNILGMIEKKEHNNNEWGYSGYWRDVRSPEVLKKICDDIDNNAIKK